MTRPTISLEGQARLREVIERAGEVLPGNGVAISNGDEILFEHYAGRVDILDSSSESISSQTIQFWASTTKLVTSVAVLQLVDRGLLSLWGPVSQFLPQLATPLRIFDKVDHNGNATYRTTSTDITLSMLLNQSAGFGGEFKAQVIAWKSTLKPGQPGGGFVNSCKGNLVNTPIVEEPGQVYQYGNCCEWLGLLVQAVTKSSLEDYCQANIFGPLGMTNSTFFPFSRDQRSRLMPLRWFNVNSGEYEELITQHPGLTLPRRTEEIEYAVGGGGLYSTASDYIRLLQHLLHHYTNPNSTCSLAPLLHRLTLDSLFQPSLAPEARPGLTAMVGEWYEAPEDGQLDWSTGMCLYLKAERRGGWGRRQGSCGWMGAGGTEYWIDPESGVACAWSSNLLPHTAPAINKVKIELEKTLYEVLAE